MWSLSSRKSFNPKIVEFGFALGEAVRIKSNGGKARISGRTDYGALGLEYRVTYWSGDNRLEIWVRADELEAVAQ